jgi:ribosomal protein L31E
MMPDKITFMVSKSFLKTLDKSMSPISVEISYQDKIAGLKQVDVWIKAKLSNFSWQRPRNPAPARIRIYIAGI